MRLTPFAAAALAVMLVFPVPAYAEASIAAYDAARQALLAIWSELPLTVRNATLTTDTALGYGNYTAHEGRSFKVGDTIHVYVEVLGYGWKDNGDGIMSELLDADLNLVDANGHTVASQEKFLSADIKSRQKLLETYLTLNATLTSFEPGEYKLQYVVHDRAGGKNVSFDVPITLTAADPSSSEAPSVDSSASSSAAQ
jgi:hypothetical protein